MEEATDTVFLSPDPYNRELDDWLEFYWVKIPNNSGNFKTF